MEVGFRQAWHTGSDELPSNAALKGNLDYVELGKLKGNQGDQNYDIPAAVDLQKYNAVVINRERFNTVFDVARQELL